MDYCDDLVNVVLRWSRRDIFDRNLFKHKVKKIPDEFQSLEKCFGVHEYPLLEEIRHCLASSIRAAWEAPYAIVESKREEWHGPGGMVFCVRVHPWEKGMRTNDKPHWVASDDVLLLSNMKLESDMDLQDVRCEYTLAVITKVLDHINPAATKFKLKAAANVDAQYVVYLTNLKTSVRSWDSLHNVANPDIIEKVLCKNEEDERNSKSCPDDFYHQMEVNFGSTLASMLNKPQIQAIETCLWRFQCDDRASVELIWGPPGTGKTMTLSVLIYILLRMNARILVCAPTNVAVAELASRVLSLFKDSFKDDCDKSLCCPFGDMVVLGNKDRVMVGPNIEEIFIDSRVDALKKCLEGETLMSKLKDSMLTSLENYVNAYQECADNELKKENRKSSLEDARDQFKDRAKSLKESMSSFFTHFPRSCVHELSYQNTVQLMSLLDSMEKKMFNDDLTFSHPSESIVYSSSLQRVRSQCKSTLNSLTSFLEKHKLSFSIGLRGFEFWKEVSGICIRNASLVFCTTSVSYTLHGKNVKPLKVLIIDEAAREKESESIIPLQVAGVRHAILVGDERQLQSQVFSAMSRNAGFGRSLFERLTTLGYHRHLLDEQFRMHPRISQFPNSEFYDGRIKDASIVKSESYQKAFLEGEIFDSYSFINILGGEEKSVGIGESRINTVEVAVIGYLVERLFKSWAVSQKKFTVGVIAPYAAQVVAIQEKLEQSIQDENFKVKVKSIDGFQGGEEDIIILSTVRTRSDGSIGFLVSPQRINVALTRARHCLWILGSAETLIRSGSIWKELICDAKTRGCYFTANHHAQISCTILSAFQENETLDKLFKRDCTLFKEARWQVTFGPNFSKSFEKLESLDAKKSVISMLLKLANGWRPQKSTVNWKHGDPSYHGIVKQFQVARNFVVFSIDIKELPTWTQVLEVWEVTPHQANLNLVNLLNTNFARYSDDFISHCSEECLEGDVMLPKSWTDFNVVKIKELPRNQATTSKEGREKKKTAAKN